MDPVPLPSPYVIPGSVFGVDSKIFYRESFVEEVKKKLKMPIGVIVNVRDNVKFEDDYHEILNRLVKINNIELETTVCSSSDIATAFGGDQQKFKFFLLAFAREIFSLEYLNVNFFITRINQKYLTDGKVTIYGDYGCATQSVSIDEFINLISDYYNIICAWKLSKIMNMSRGQFLMDGSSIFRSGAWSELSSKQKPYIIFEGDKTIPIISAADLIVRYIELFLKEKKLYIDEKTIQEIVCYDGKIKKDTENIHYFYVGNPDLKDIKPSSDQIIPFNHVKECVWHPIIFISGGGIVGQRNIIQYSPLMSKIYKFASTIGAGIKFYDPKRDSKLIGTSDKPDYYISLGAEADNQFELLEKSGYNVIKLDVKKLEG